ADSVDPSFSPPHHSIVHHHAGKLCCPFFGDEEIIVVKLDGIATKSVAQEPDVFINQLCRFTLPPCIVDRHHGAEGTFERTAHARMISNGAGAEVSLAEVSLDRI